MSAVATITETVRNAAQALQPHSESPRLDAEVLLAAVLRLERSALITHGNDAVDSGHERAYNDLISARAAGTRQPCCWSTASGWSSDQPARRWGAAVSATSCSTTRTCHGHTPRFVRAADHGC